VPTHRVIAIYARENGQGMAFPLHDAPQNPAGSSHPLASVADTLGSPRQETKLHQIATVTQDNTDEEPDPPRPTLGPRPALKRVK
jgi:stringent starvation protein B